jgi:hypothetical protein
VVLVFAGCSSSVKTPGEAAARLKARKIIAILAFEVRFDPRKKNHGQFTEKELAELRHFVALDLQEHLYHHFLCFAHPR